MRTSLLLILIALTSAGYSADQPESGTLSVYAPHYQGRPTASGEIYDRNALTAAHETLPFGTLVRVANLKTGKMVDLRINDRKSRDQSVLTVSEDAAKRLGASAGMAMNASYLVLGQAAPAPASVNTQGGQGAFSGIQKKGIFGGKSSAPSAAVPRSSYPTGPYPGTAATTSAIGTQNNQQQKSGGFSLGGLFGGKDRTAVSLPRVAYSAPQVPVNTSSYAQPKDLVPLNAVAPASSSAMEVMARTPPSSVLPGQPAAAPYRVQFGAYRRSSNAYDTSGVLTRSGVGNMVVQSPATNLFLVVTSAGFTSASGAQQWIDAESSRRGWRERPVVIR
tara:strand:+ start:1843 stop:2844 length:1002 start_codon:yes stop_codon:yes gene_type:complete